jgi:hypothetical protein
MIASPAHISVMACQAGFARALKLITPAIDRAMLGRKA